MIFFWSIKTRYKPVGKSTMGCPNCNQPMTIYWARRWFKLFFILPLFPTAPGSYVQGCAAGTCPADEYYSIDQQEAAQMASGQKMAA